MNKNDIDQIRIDMECDGESALSMMIHRDGTLGRSGNGSLPSIKLSAMGILDDRAFKTLIDLLDDRIFQHAGTYDIKDKVGALVIYSIAFLQNNKPLAVFQFRFGLENQAPGGLVAYFDGFIQQAVALTNDWYNEAVEKDKKI